MTDDDDFARLIAWRDGDSSAGAELLRRHFEGLYRFFRNKVDGDVNDLVQKTLLACVRGKDGLRGEATFRTWLFTVARHELFRHFRKQVRTRGEAEIGECSVVDLGTSPSGMVARAQEHRLLLRALRAIPLELQITIELHYWEGMTTQELAGVLEIPQGTVKSRLRRARAALADAMRKLATADDDVETTIAQFDRWVQAVRQAVEPEPQSEPQSESE